MQIQPNYKFHYFHSSKFTSLDIFSLLQSNHNLFIKNNKLIFSFSDNNSKYLSQTLIISLLKKKFANFVESKFRSISLKPYDFCENFIYISIILVHPYKLHIFLIINHQPINNSFFLLCPITSAKTRYRRHNNINICSCCFQHTISK